MFEEAWMFVSFCSFEKEVWKNILQYLVLKKAEKWKASGQSSQDRLSLVLFLLRTDDQTSAGDRVVLRFNYLIRNWKSVFYKMTKKMKDKKKRARSLLSQGYVYWEMETRMVPWISVCELEGHEGRKGISGSLKELLTLVQVFVQVRIFKPQWDTREKYFKWIGEFCGHGYYWWLRKRQALTFSVQICRC